MTGNKIGEDTLSILGKNYVSKPNVVIRDNVTLYSGVMFQGERKIVIGNDTAILNNTIIYAEKDSSVVIENHCRVAPMCHIVNAEHNIRAGEYFDIQGSVANNILREDDVLITSNVTIVKGSNIRKVL